MNTGPTFVAHIEAAKPMEPGQRAFHDPPRATEPTPMGRAALGELGVDPAAMQRVAMRLRIVVGSSRVDLQACKLEYSIVSPK